MLGELDQALAELVERFPKNGGGHSRICPPRRRMYGNSRRNSISAASVNSTSNDQPMTKAAFSFTRTHSVEMSCDLLKPPIRNG